MTTTPDAPLFVARPPVQRAKQRCLSPAEVQRLVVAYDDGALIRNLAAQFNIHRQTVSAVLRRHGVNLRLRGLSSERVSQAVLMYAQGQSLAKIGKHLEVDAGTVHARLREAGVVMRDPWERLT